MFRTVKSIAIESRVVVSYGWHQRGTSGRENGSLRTGQGFLSLFSMMKQPKMECSDDCIHEYTKMVTNTLKCKLFMCLEYIYIAYFKWVTYSI